LSTSTDSQRGPGHEGAEATPLANPSFVGYVLTQFLGAFNDNLFKQLILLLAVPAVAMQGAEGVQGVVGGQGVGGESGGSDVQGIATIVFGLPFVVFGGIAGYLADRYSKRRVIVLCKVAEVFIAAAGLFAFLAAPRIGFLGLWVVLFAMGTHSTFFGPGKYGILPEILRRDQLSRANGIVMMTTFVAIILGTASAGPIKDWLGPQGGDRYEAAGSLWMASLVCIGVAVLGTWVSRWIRPVPIAAPDLKFTSDYWLVPPSMRRLLMADRPLLLALFASCGFWLIAGLTVQAVNSLCKVQVGLSDTYTSLMVALISIGIAAGGLTAGWMSRGGGDQRVVRLGMWGVVIGCGLLTLTLPGGGLMVGKYGLPLVLIFLGGAAAFFSIPIQVFLQSRPPADLKGRMIAVMNQANFLAIVLSGGIYIALDQAVIAFGLPRSAIFAAMAMLFLPFALGYRLEGSPPSWSAGDGDDRS
jgi:acyl-[acyl-carrier-protein]-phospholipid O-acyltransferase/long-chain-fatty-acid--[acyl-carrier-protein] ligase